MRYLRLCWRLQDTYKLEPAGSHGVWGLDDYNFLPYLFGSGQLRGMPFPVRPTSAPSNVFLDQTTIPVNAILGVKLSQGADPIDSFDNLYFMAIARIHQVKYGPFFEHSSQLYSIATHVQSWAKVNKGLFEMYQACRPCVRLSTVLTRLLLQAEVLGKRVVVQHLPLGGLIEWDH